MKTCFQTKGMSILEHGHSVHNYYLDLHNYLYNDVELQYQWRLPEWLLLNKEYIKSKLFDLDILHDYHIYHDCGKPQCVTIDENEKQHFPDHALASAKRWEQCTVGTVKNTQIGHLIRMDMDIHLLDSVGLPPFSQRPEAISLLITGLCEIHSNAAMFGGIESTSFKIKWKHIDKRGRQLLNLIKDQNG